VRPKTRSNVSLFRPARDFLAMAAIVGIVWIHGIALRAQSGNGGLKLDTGQEIYMAGCVSCHGPDGKGQLQTLTGFERPSTFPDFTDCPGATPEPDVQWRAVITEGGPGRGFSPIMPSFKDMLTAEQINKVIEYLRTLCPVKAWPRGNLNLPLAMITEKAYPENEVVITGAYNAHGAPGGTTSVIYEKRIGVSSMIGAIVPYSFKQDSTGNHAALGDVALEFKRKMFDRLKTGSIFSLGGDISIPTGNRTIGTGGESTLFEVFAAYGQLLPRDSFLQLQTGVELPVHPDKVPRAYFMRTAIGKTFSNEGGLGRRWSPMLEIIADRDLVTGAKTNVDLAPELQIPLSRRMHILGAIGYRIPVNNTGSRPRQLMFYLLWDFPDGGLRQGWR
jgi:mono/diheme cytochrome c family protein